jgi:glycerol uptake facilitator-like aquaporin
MTTYFSVGDALLALTGAGSGVGDVTLKKLECSKQAYALNTLAWNNAIGLHSYCVGLREGSND